MGTAFVFEPDTDYGRVDAIRKAGRMPVAGLTYVASVTGRWKMVKIVDFGEVETDLAGRLDLLSGLDENAIVLGLAKVRKSTYLKYTALVRIDVRVANPADLFPQLAGVMGVSLEELEADVVVGDFDIFTVVVDDEEGNLGTKILNIRAIDGVKRTVSLRVIDYVSTSESARNVEGDHYVDPFLEGDHVG